MTGSDLRGVYQPTARRLRERCAEKGFETRAARACAGDAAAMRAIITGLARLKKEHLRHGIGVIRASKSKIDHVKDV